MTSTRTSERGRRLLYTVLTAIGLTLGAFGVAAASTGHSNDPKPSVASEDKSKPDTDNVECNNGLDPNTGAECDGGPAANQANDPNEPAGEDEANSKEADNGVDCADGIDVATGAECDGGPAANQANDPNEPNSNESD